MLLKSSDFVVHDFSADSVFEGCVDVEDSGGDGAEGRGRDGRENGARARDGRLKKAYELELVLRKWFAIDPSREMRAFVRDGVLVGASSVPNLCPCLCLCVFIFVSINLSPQFDVIESGISQRDTNYYEFLNEPPTQRKIVSSFVAYWTTHVKPKWTGPPSCESTFEPPSLSTTG